MQEEEWGLSGSGWFKCKKGNGGWGGGCLAGLNARKGMGGGGGGSGWFKCKRRNWGGGGGRIWLV